MSYIGNTNTTQAFTPAVDFFNGNGSTTAFTLSRPVASVAQVQAVISNVPQKPGDAYTVSGNTITFTSAPPSGTQNIYVYYTSPITQVIAPGQNTVGTAQIQNGAVIPADLSAGAPTWSPTGGVSLPRIDTGNEGGQLNLNRASDDTNAWSLDVYGSGTNTAMRVLDTANGVEIMRWNQSGSLPLRGANTSANGVGIVFPAAQSASSDANTLDDYEEGSWTPTLEFGGASVGISYTGSGRVGRYTKVGNLVTVSCFIELTNKGSSTGTARISGMPFTVRQLSAAWGLSGGGSGLAWGSMGVNLVYSQSAPIPSTANTLLIGTTVGTTILPALTDASFSNSGYVGFTMTYEVA